jgi:hypothetical protein
MLDLSSLEGWTFCIQGSGDTFFRIGPDGVNPVIDTPSYTLTSANENCLTVFHGVIDVLNSSISLYRNGNLEGSQVTVSYAPTSSRISIGVFPNGLDYPLTQGGFCGGGAIDAAMTPAEISAHYAAMVVAGGSVVPVDILGNSWNYNTENANAVWPSDGSYSDALLRSGNLTYTTQPLVWYN